jgi:putative ATP-binding cassette transporter
MIRLLAGLTGLATLGFGVGAYLGNAPIYLPVLAALVVGALLLCDGLPQRQTRVPMVMRFLIGLFALSFVIFGLILWAASASVVPDDLVAYLPQSGSSIIAAILVFLNLAICYIPLFREIIDLVNPYFERHQGPRVRVLGLGLREDTIAKLFLAFIVILNVIQVYLTVIFNFWNNRFYTAMQDKNQPAFWGELAFFGIVATFWITRGLIELFATEFFKVRWRRWMTDRYVGQWLSNKTHYKLAVTGHQSDNPDQRISEDVRDFIDKGFDFYINIFNTILTLYAFVQILWMISNEFPYSVAGFDLVNIPGYLVWGALIVSVIVTFGSHYLGRPLVGLFFQKQRLEADFRYALVRVRENSEQIALLDGEGVERTGLADNFQRVFRNTIDIVIRRIKLGCFNLAYSQALNVLPFVFLAPAYFATASMKLGALTQTSEAFGNVQQSFSFFITNYRDLAEFKSMVNRLTNFDKAIKHAEESAVGGIELIAGAANAMVSSQGLNVNLPTGKKLIQNATVSFPKGVSTLVTGPSGSGKTTLFRAIAGIWPFGSGKINAPADENIMLLPQQTYMPLGTLRAALTYPLPDTAFSQEVIEAALEQVGLGNFTARLDTSENWAGVLSGGEKQRVSIVRALLRKPAWLFLDEATSALDEKSEGDLYRLLREALPGATIVSIGHRASLAAYHERRLAVVKDNESAHIEEQPVATFGT